jgi:uncharacterized protein involved in exopolysaccharide biosynthesis
MNGIRQLDPTAMVRALRRKSLLILGLAAALGSLSLVITFLITPRFTSRSLVQVAPQVLPQGYVKPIVTEKLPDRVATLEERVLTRGRLLPMIERLNLAGNDSPEKVLERVRGSISVLSAEPGASPSAPPSKKKTLDRDNVPGFFVLFTWNHAKQAQQICAEITSMLLDENLKLREQVGQNTTEFLGRQLIQAKHDLDALDSQLADFKRLHLGRLPGDVENNLRILAGLDTQLDASTQALGRAQQEKSFAESLLSQETAVWKSNQEAPNLPSLREELVTLQNQVITLQSRYTNEHPDVLKTKKDIAEIQQQLKETKADVADLHSSPGSRAQMEPPEILRLREKIHQEEIAIERATAEQSRLKEQISIYQASLAVSPDIEEQYKQLTRDNETAHAIYTNLLTNEKSAEVQTAMEREQQGEQLKLLEAASLPDAPSFPVRWMFTVGGCGLGLAIGIGWVLFWEMMDKSLRNAGDVENLLGLPTLALVPFAKDVDLSIQKSTRNFWKRPLSV